MKKLNLILWIFILVFNYNTVAKDIDKIQSQLLIYENVCGKFLQKKNLVGISKPLSSNGNFCINKNEGILWETLKPFANTLKISKNQIVQFRAGKELNKVSQEPMLEFVNSLIFSIFSGDFSKLEENFIIKVNANNNFWEAHLQAKTELIGKILKEVKISGDKYIRFITIKESSGDMSEISFSDFQ